MRREASRPEPHVDKPITVYDVIVRGHPIPIDDEEEVAGGSTRRAWARLRLRIAAVRCASMLRTAFAEMPHVNRRPEIDPSTTTVAATRRTDGTLALWLVPHGWKAVTVTHRGGGPYVVTGPGGAMTEIAGDRRRIGHAIAAAARQGRASSTTRTGN